jgi:hypothetical protein
MRLVAEVNLMLEQIDGPVIVIPAAAIALPRRFFGHASVYWPNIMSMKEVAGALCVAQSES